MIKTLISIALAILLPSTSFAKYQDLTIIVSSCDKYSSLWDPFFGSLFKHWPSLQTDNQGTPILLIGNKQEYSHPRVTMVNIPVETSWTDNILTTLETVETKYVLIMLDDYWLNTNVNEKRLEQLFTTMRAENAAMLQISGNDLRYQAGPKHPITSGLMYRDKYAQYKVSLQAAIWEKQALLDLLRPGENPWEFELAGTARSHGYPKLFLTVYENEPIKYLNAVYQGHVQPYAIAHATEYNLPFDNQFPVLGWFNPKLTAKIWQARIQKAVSFLQHPGSFYKM